MNDKNEKRTKSGAIINQHCSDEIMEHAWAFVVFTDSFMSGWGKAPGRSLYAMPVSNPRQAELVLASGKRRGEMKRGRIVKDVRRIRLHEGDHLSIANPVNCSRWFEVDGLGEDA